MLDFIKCPGCGTVLGNIYIAYQAIKTSRLKKMLSDNSDRIDIHHINVVPVADIRRGDVLDDLHIRKICCREHIIGATGFHEAVFK